MSRQPAESPACTTDDGADPVQTVLVPKVRDLGDFEVRRALPAPERRMVGPFIFFDHMGPTTFKPGQAVDVRPHPHIGLATVTWLVRGEIMHRDSLGHAQLIRPGEVNWMTAGSGIVHSERTPAEARGGGAELYGLQTWLALPKDREETDPGFSHFAADALPVIEGEGARAVVIAGTGWGARSPVPVFSDTLYADVRLDKGARIEVPREAEERGLYVLDGGISVAGQDFAEGTLAVFEPGVEVIAEAAAASHIVLIGGAAMDGPRHIWWNFVSSSKERIEQAKADWKAGRFPPVPGDDEFIPLPED